MKLLPFSIFFISIGLLHLHGVNWPQFRGGDQTGVITEYEIPTSWTADENIKWRIPNPGVGWSSPVVWGDRVFITATTISAEEQARRETGGSEYRISMETEINLNVICYDKDSGAMLWKKVAYAGLPKIITHGGSPYSAETPVTDGERIYAYFGAMGLYAYDFSGNQVWSKDLGVFEMDGQWGTGTSPMIHNGVLYMQIDNEDFSTLHALDGKTGKEIWRVNREEGPNRSTPIIWKNRLRTELVTQGLVTRSYNPDNGELYWQLYLQGGRSSSMPVGDDDRLIIANEKRGAGGFMFSVKAGASGDISLAEGETSNHGVEWVNPNGGIAMSSPLIYNGNVYAFERRTGMVSCYDAETGDVHYYRKHVPKAREFWSSPWGYDGHVYCIDGKGITHVLDAGTEFNEVRQNIIDDQIWSSPALTPGSIIIRGVDYLYSVENKGPVSVGIE
jgi:outer membrane protein assembly factor BamB